ncbi:MAG TPA: DUF47 family protein [Planktothrix sp.]|jgi:hypothetical protein
MAKTAHCPSWLKFLKPKTDFFALLREQAESTVEGLRGLQTYIASGSEAGCKAVHEMEHKADDQKLELQKQLKDNFVTPFDREEIYDLSSLLDLVLNAAKRTVKDIEFTKERLQNKYLEQMSDLVVAGAQDVLDAFKNLNQDLSKSQECAHKARKTEPHVYNIYREALAELVQESDSTRRVQTKHFYDCIAVIAERIERLGEKLLHISIKLG